MSENKDTEWHNIIQGFDEFDKKLDIDIEDESLESFLTDLNKTLSNNHFEPWQLQEAKVRTQKIIDRLEELYSSLHEEGLDISENRRKFDSYFNTLKLGSK